MAKHAANRFEGSITIPGRPEVRLGLPVYVESRDCFYYVSNITHSFTFGSQFTTTLGLRGRRAKFASTEYVGRTVLGDVTLNIDLNGVNRDNEGRNIGIPSAIMRVATEEETESIKSNIPAFGHGTTQTDGEPASMGERSGGFVDPSADAGERVRQRDDERRGISWFMGGHYWVYDAEPSVTAITWNPPDRTDDREFDIDQAAIPLSDADGYELIGAFPYGRGLVINSSGEITSTTGQLDDTGLPIPVTDATVADVVAVATALRNATPDDLAQATESVSQRSSIGGGILSTASVLKVDQTNDGLMFAEMVPDDEHANQCSCVDNYTIDNLIPLLQGVEGVLTTDVNNLPVSIDQLLENSYLVSDVTDYEAQKLATRQATTSAPYSPSVSEDVRALDSETE
jgi:hypothetical protein